MQQPLIPRRFLVVLLLAALVIPIALCVILGVAAILGAMGDAVGAAWSKRLALAGGMLWGIDLICLLIVLAIDALRTSDDEKTSE